MKISNKLKDIIFKKLNKELSNVEIIPYNDSIWFIDRENKYWYFEYEKNGTLWWRNSFFDNFFVWFSVERHDFEPIISEWVEEVLNCKVNTLSRHCWFGEQTVEEVLNCKVNTLHTGFSAFFTAVEEVLNCKVNTLAMAAYPITKTVEEVLNCKVNTTGEMNLIAHFMVEEVLNCKVTKTHGEVSGRTVKINEVLN